MTKPTREQILACTDDKQLIKWVAAHCFDGYIGINLILSDDFNPLADTSEGKAQCFDLMVKYELFTTFDKDGGYISNATLGVIKDKNPQKAICIAALLCACEVE